MKHFIVSVSGGAGSTVAAHRCVEKHGAANTTVPFDMWVHDSRGFRE